MRTLIHLGADVHSMDLQERTPMIWAAIFDQVEAIFILYNEGASTEYGNESALTYASAEGKIEAMRALIAIGSDTEYEDDTGMTPLQWASYGGNMDAMGILIDIGVDMEYTDEQGNTALTWASWAYRKSTLCVRFLIDRGAIDTSNCDGTAFTRSVTTLDGLNKRQYMDIYASA